MGLFTEDTKLKMIPRSAGSYEGEAYLQNLIGSTPAIPQQQVAGLTPIQMLIQQELGNYLQSSENAGNLAGNYYKSILDSNYDVFNDPRYQALNIQAGQNARTAETAAKRLGEGQGVLNSSPTQQKIYTDVAATQSPLLMAIGDLLTNRENLKANAAQGIQSSEAQRLQNISAINDIANVSRTIEQQKLDVLFNQLMSQIVFPYQYQAQLANSLMNYQQPYAVTGGGLNDLGFITQLGAQVGGMALGGYLGGLGGAGAAAGGVNPVNYNDLSPYQQQLFKATM